MKICAATGNAGKLRELRRILEAQGHEVVSQKELGITIEPEETGTTFAENALIKAETICSWAVRPASTVPATAAATATTKPTTTSFWAPCRLCLPGSAAQSSSQRCASSCRMGGI